MSRIRVVFFGTAELAAVSLNRLAAEPWAAILGVVVSVGVGLFFGLWPANRAARLDPVDALRYE